jgi:hypothetical protein
MIKPIRPPMLICHVIQGDNVSVPRMARAIAGVIMQLSGKDCVVESSKITEEDGNDVGRLLNIGLTWRVFVDGVEEATSGYSRFEISLPGLDIGQHTLESRFSFQSKTKKEKW